MNTHKVINERAMFFIHGIWGTHGRNIIAQFQKYFQARDEAV